VLIVPSLIAYALGLLFSLDITIVRDTFPLLLACIGYGLVMSLSAGLLILALSSLSRNSRYVGLFWLAVWFVSSIVGTVLEGVNREHRMHATYRKQMAVDQARPPGPPPKTPEEHRKRAMEQQESHRKLWREMQQEELNLAKSDWRPLVSYTANLSRVGKQWLGTDACWEKMSTTLPEEERPRFLLEALGPQYPWYWSAAVLAVLFGISACILNFRVKSLDRLK
jgi:ABC-2 type transport system permease protein